MQDPGRALPSIGWSVAEVEDYSPDFHMYWEAIRCVCVRCTWVCVYVRVRVCVCVFKRAWSVAEVEDYSPDFHMYWEAIRCVCACMCVARVCVCA